MNRKNVLLIATAATVLALPAAAGAEGTAPESIQFETAAEIIPAVGDTFDAAAALEITGEGASQDILYSSYDDSVAEVSQDGVITAKGYGTTTIIAASVEDDTVSASMDVAVFDLYGTYSGTKTIEAMGCDVAIDLTLNEDGTYSYYRAPIMVDMEGGGEMPELEEEGTYELEGAEITFASEELGGYTLTFTIDGEDGCLKGKLPTGGASTEMELTKEASEAEGEEETAEEESGSEEASEKETAAETEEGTEK